MKIDFSKDGEGAILMTAVGNTLYLDKNLSNDMKIGDLVPMNYKNFERLAELNFYKTESIDILIEKLITIKNYILLASAG
jgi:hypothetical protein